MWKWNLTGMLLGGMLTLNAQITDLLISEYVEGSSNNKYLELYNGTGSPIDLGAGGYVVEVYANASNTPTSLIPLNGLLPAGGVFVIAHPSATAWSGTPDLSSNGLNFNGNDAVALRKGAALIDLVGNIGCMPDIEWGTGLLSTADNTIRRKPGACWGVTIDPPNQPNCPFPTLTTDWDGFPIDEVSGLGFHTTTCTPIPTVAFALPDSELQEGNTGVTNHPVAVIMDVAPASPVNVTVTDAGTGSATPGLDYAFSSATLTFSPNEPYPATKIIVVPVVGDTQAEPDETVDLVMSVTGGNASLGLATHIVTILNDDLPSILYSQADGQWSAVNLWNTMPDGSGVYVTDPNNTQGPSGPEYHCIIQPGHDIILPATKGITTLVVQAGGSIKAGTTTSRYLEIYGNSVLVNGIMGNGGANDGIGLEFHSPAASISGMGTIDLNRIRKNGFTATQLSIEASLQLRFNGAALYNDIAGYPFNVTIQPGVTVTVTRGDVSIDGVDGANSSNRWGAFTILGNLHIQLGKLYLRTDNATAGSQDIHYLLGPGALVTVGGQVVGNQGNAGNAKAHLTLQGGAQLVLTGPGEVMTSTDPVRSPVACQPNSVIDYAGTAAQFVEDEITYANLRSSGGGLKTLEGPTSVNGFLLLINGLVRLGAHDLIIAPGGQTSGGSPGSYVQTDGTGLLRQTVGATTRLFPIGLSTFNLLTLTNTSSPDVFGARVTDQGPEPALVVDRTWYLEEATPGGSSATLTLQWNAPEELPGFTRSASYISRHTPTGWNGDNPSPATGANPYFQTRSGLSAFGNFAVASGQALPVTWLSFRAEPAEGGESVHLTWSTASESDNKGFAVERSYDAVDFSGIGFVPGAGTTSEVHHYSFSDSSLFTPHTSLLYYRLKQIDHSGAWEYSPIRVVELEGPGQSWRAYPNPAHGELHLRFAEVLEKPVQVRLVNALGREAALHTVQAGMEEVSLPIDHLPRGAYLLEVDEGVRVSRTLVLFF